MSRQRIRTGVLEGSTVICPHCAGVGTVRSTSSIALHVLRVLEDALIKSATHNIIVRTRTEVALYILNQKRANLRDLERRFGVAITIAADDTLTGMAYHAMERGEPAAGVPELPSPPPVTALEAPEIEAEIEEPEGEEDTAADQAEAQEGAPGNDEEGGARRKRRRRRRRGRNSDREASGIQANAPQPSDDALAYVAGFGGPVEAEPAEGESESEVAEGETAETAETDVLPPREERSRRRRPRRRGRGGGEQHEANAEQSEDAASAAEVFEAAENADLFGQEPGEAVSRTEAIAPEPVTHHSEPIAPAAPPFAHEEASAVPAAIDTAGSLEPKSAPESEAESTDPDRPKRTGWWRRAKASLGN